MNFFTKLFRREPTEECPRCLGKGHVDLEDIKRLKKELFWRIGKCAYCKGKGKVPQHQIQTTRVDLEYLTTDISSEERSRLINNDKSALDRAELFKKEILTSIEDIRNLYYLENKEPVEIADWLAHKYGNPYLPRIYKMELIDYINKVINHREK